MHLTNHGKFIIALLVPIVVGSIGAVFTSSSVDTWYPTLVKPVFTPPDWIFGPVWTVLYLLMGVAAFFVWREGVHRKVVRQALVMFLVQLFLNMLWSILFFGLRSPAGACIEIIFLWMAIVATIVLFAKVSKPGALLLVPYVVWVTFAAYLNYTIWKLQLIAGA